MKKVDLLILGDSHVTVFLKSIFRFFSSIFLRKKIEVVSVEVATISDIENPNLIKK